MAKRSNPIFLAAWHGLRVTRVKPVAWPVDSEGMKIWRTSMSATSQGVQDNRRRHGRLKTEGTESSLGSVVDMSASGMRVHRRGALPVAEGEKFRVDVQIDKEIMSIDVIVRRVRKLGRRKFEFGLEFIHLSDEDRIRLGRLARIATTSARAMW